MINFDYHIFRQPLDVRVRCLEALYESQFDLTYINNRWFFTDYGLSKSIIKNFFGDVVDAAIMNKIEERENVNG